VKNVVESRASKHSRATSSGVVMTTPENNSNGEFSVLAHPAEYPPLGLGAKKNRAGISRRKE